MVNRLCLRAACNAPMTLALLPRGGNADEHVAGTPERLHLLGEDEIVTEIVADGRQHGRIGRQRDGRKRRPVHQEPVDELRGPVLGIRRAPAVARQQNLASARHGDGHAPGGLGHLAPVDGKKIAAQFRAVFRMLGNHLQGFVHKTLLRTAWLQAQIIPDSRSATACGEL